MSTTRNAREAAMQCLYGFDMTGETHAPSEERTPEAATGTEKPESGEDEHCGIEKELKTKSERDFVNKILALAQEHMADVNALIESNSHKWSLDRISKVDLAILRLSLLEIEFLRTPEKIAINEAVELAKKYSGDKSYQFVNGVLAGYVKSRHGTT